MLIYGTAEGSSFDQLKWYARDGSTVGSLNPVIDYQQFTLSPDAKHLALNSFHQHATGSLWLIDIATNTTTPLTYDPHSQSDPVWSPDSRYVAFNLLPNGGTDPPFLVQKIEIGNQQPHLIYGDDAKTLGGRLVTGWSLFGDARYKDGFDTPSDGQHETSGGVFIELPERCISSVARRAPDRLRGEPQWEMGGLCCVFSFVSGDKAGFSGRWRTTTVAR